MYCPPELIIEVNDIKREDNLPDSNPVAIRELVKYARIGREVDRLTKLDWSRKIPLPKIDNSLPGRSKPTVVKGKRRNGFGGFF